MLLDLRVRWARVRQGHPVHEDREEVRLHAHLVRRPPPRRGAGRLGQGQGDQRDHEERGAGASGKPPFRTRSAFNAGRVFYQQISTRETSR